MKPLHDWGVLAEVLKEAVFDPDYSSPGELLANAVEDGYQMETIPGWWLFVDDEDARPEYLYPGFGVSKKAISELVEKLRGLDYVHAWAAIVAVRWYWDHHSQLNCEMDHWWTLNFRREWVDKHEKDEPAPKKK